MNINFMKVHQPNMPAPEFEHKSISKSKFADSVVENDTRIGRIMDKVRALGLDKNTYVFWTTDNGAWQDVYPDAGYTPFRGTKGTVREGGNRVPSIAWGPKIKAGYQEFRHRRRPRLYGDVCRFGGAKLPENDREGKPIIFDSYDMSPVLFGTGKSPRNVLVLLHGKRADAGRGARRATTRPYSTCAAMTASKPADSRSIQSGLERPGGLRRHRPAGVRPVAGPAGTLRHLHEQLHGTHLGHGDHQ